MWIINSLKCNPENINVHKIQLHCCCHALDPIQYLQETLLTPPRDNSETTELFDTSALSFNLRIICTLIHRLKDHVKYKVDINQTLESSIFLTKVETIENLVKHAV